MVREIMRIENAILEHPETIEIVITELNTLLQKFDPAAKGRPAAYPLVPVSFDSGEILERIRAVSRQPKLKITDIRFKADQLAKLRKIALPKATMNHKDPLLQWYKIHWDTLADDIRGWRGFSGPSSDDD
jgi:hypothetical protein